MRSGPAGLLRLSGPLLKIYGTIVADNDQQIFATSPLEFVIESTRVAGNAFAARPIASSRQNAPSALELDGNVDGASSAESVAIGGGGGYSPTASFGLLDAVLRPFNT